MSKLIAILRGINVGGKRKILMADLRTLLEKEGFQNVSTYIQSGNVFFDKKDNLSNTEITESIAEIIKKNYGFEVPVLLTTHEEVNRIINNNPFIKDENTDTSKLHITFLKDIPAAAKIEEIKSFDTKNDTFIIEQNIAFIYCEGKYHQSKLTNNFFEKKLETTATTRNWKTILKLHSLSK